MSRAWEEYSRLESSVEQLRTALQTTMNYSTTSQVRMGTAPQHHSSVRTQCCYSLSWRVFRRWLYLLWKYCCVLEHSSNQLKRVFEILAGEIWDKAGAVENGRRDGRAERQQSQLQDHHQLSAEPRWENYQLPRDFCQLCFTQLNSNITTLFVPLGEFLTTIHYMGDKQP